MGKLIRHLEFSFVVLDEVYGGSIIGELLRMWIVRESSCLLLLVIFCLIGLGFGDSHLVTHSLCFLVFFSLVFNFLFCSFLFYSLYFLWFGVKIR